MVIYNVYGRVSPSHYTPFFDPKKNALATIREGFFIKGHQNGFGRMLGN
jgi:hypothetical protein